MQFNARCGCNWCLHEGEEIWHRRGTARKYTVTNEVRALRTQEQTLLHLQETLETGRPVFGVKKVSPLINLIGYDIIDSFVPDYMHNVNLGVVKQFAEYWFNTPHMPYTITNEHTDNINSQLKSFKVPTQLCRLSRSLNDRHYWKAKEWENWLLNYSLPLLAQVPGFQNYLKHWALLVEAMHLLLKERISMVELRRAHGVLKQFVVQNNIIHRMQ